MFTIHMAASWHAYTHMPDVFLDHGHLKTKQSRLQACWRRGDYAPIHRHGGHEEERGSDEIQESHGGGRLGLKDAEGCRSHWGNPG